MPRTNTSLLAFNRGRISALGLARTDIDRTRLSAEVQTNWMPRTLGSMMLRPGTQYITSTKSNGEAKGIPFVFAQDDTAAIELTDQVMRVLVDDELITRPSVSASVTNGSFASNVTGWTDQDETGATSSWATGGYLSLVGTGVLAAKREQGVSVTETGTVHALRIVIERGLVTLRVGSSSGDDDYISETVLGVGTHSLAFTPTGTFYIQLWGFSKAASLVDSVTVESAGTMELPTPWEDTDLANIRHDQSGDVIYVACDGGQQYKIERRGVESWSVVKYEPEDGPFRVINTGPITLTASAITGDITLTASQPLFKSGHVGALFKHTSSGQEVTATVSGEDQWTDPIRITGVGAQRKFSIITTGTWSATMTLQYSVGSPGVWVDATTYGSNKSISYDDGLDNEIIYYRLGVKAGDYTSGSINMTLSFPSGSITGIVRIKTVATSQIATAAVLVDLGGTDATDDWYEGAWSSYRGFPTAVALYEGRLWWAGRDSNWGSISDSYESFDEDFEGDAGPISRSIGSGPVDVINWLLPLQRLILGTAGKEVSARSTSFDEPLTPTNYNLKDMSTQGSKAAAPVKIDTKGLFIQKGGTRVFEAAYQIEANDYASLDLTVHIPEMGEPGIKCMFVQRQPDTRVHCIRTDGTVAVLVYDKAENLTCWIDVNTADTGAGACEVEDGFVLPGLIEDAVYYIVKRTINGSTVRFIEKWAYESECVGGTLNKQVDAFVTFTGPSATITGLSHLEGETVKIWADGKDLGEGTVSGGSVTASESVTSAVVGLGYSATFKSTKLAYAASATALAQTKTIEALGVILKNTHYQGLQYGRDADNLDNLPLVEDAQTTADDTIWSEYDKPMFAFEGEWDTDCRLVLVANSPRPATVLAAVMTIETNER